VVVGIGREIPRVFRSRKPSAADGMIEAQAEGSDSRVSVRAATVKSFGPGHHP